MADRDSVMRDFPSVTVRVVTDHPEHAGPYEIKDPRTTLDPTLTSPQGVARTFGKDAGSDTISDWFAEDQADLDATWA